MYNTLYYYNSCPAWRCSCKNYYYYKLRKLESINWEKYIEQFTRLRTYEFIEKKFYTWAIFMGPKKTIRETSV